MSIWSKAWLKSIAVHILVAILVMGVSYLSMPKQIVAKGVKVRLGGGNLGGHGQGGRFIAPQTGDAIPTHDILEAMPVSKNPNPGSRKKSSIDNNLEKKKTVTPLTTSRDTMSGVLGTDDEKRTDGDVIKNDKTMNEGSNSGESDFDGEGDGTGGVEGTRGSNGMGTAPYGMSYGNGGDGNGYGYGSGPFSGTGFYSNGDGTYTATSPDGLEFEILTEVYPSYPVQAEEAAYTRIVIARAKFIVGLDGSVESVELLNDLPNLGFAEATISSLRQWRFTPIKYKGIPIKVEFTKQIRFVPN